MADKPISDPLCRNIGNISSPSRFFFPTVNVIDMAICTDICTVRSFVQYSNLYGMVDCTVL